MSERLLHLVNLSCEREGRRLFSGLNLSLAAGEVAALTGEEVDAALGRGLGFARRLQANGQILAATLGLNGEVRMLEAAAAVAEIRQHA